MFNIKSKNNLSCNIVKGLRYIFFSQNRRVHYQVGAHPFQSVLFQL